MTIKEKIQKILKEKGISAVKMENDLGFAKGYISKLDKASPSSDYIVKISEYLGVTTDSLLKDENALFVDMDSKDPVKDQMLRVFQSLAPDDQRLVLELAIKFAKDKR